MNPKLKPTPEGFCVFREDSHLSRWIEEQKRLDAGACLPFLEKYLPVGGTAIDIGASLGDHTIVLARRVGPTGRVLAFEANEDAAEACALNMKPHPWVGVYPMALGDRRGMANIVRDINVGASFLVEDSSRGTIAYESLDEIAAREGWAGHHIDFIKIDAEGWEPRILSGAAGIIYSHRPVMVIEVARHTLIRQGSSPGALLSLLEAFGYRTHPEDSVQYDMLAIPKEFP